MGARTRTANPFAAIPVVPFVVAVTLGMALGGRFAAGQQDAAQQAKPGTHFKIERPADMLPETAETVYQNIRTEMAAGYALARMPKLRNYLSWRRFNMAPYRSATHGARYVNNYGNKLGADYQKFEQAGPLPVGSMLVEDSFSATADGAIYPGPMFVMEKMQPGFKPESGDWRYIMFMPGGSLFGETGGFNSESVEFCIGCHVSRREYDHLFFPPQPYRRKPIDIGR